MAHSRRLCRCSFGALLAAAATAVWVEVLLFGVELGSLVVAWEGWVILAAFIAAPPAAALCCALRTWRGSHDVAAVVVRGAAVLLLVGLASAFCLAAIGAMAAPF